MGKSVRLLHLENEFPGLRPSGYRKTSEKTCLYNCIAYAAGDTARWWSTDPNYHWPQGAIRDDGINALISAFEVIGYEQCGDGDFEEGFEKVALYAKEGRWKHAARQLASGYWTSKMGGMEDIQHQTLDAIEGDTYGFTTHFMRRSL